MVRCGFGKKGKQGRCTGGHSEIRGHDGGVAEKGGEEFGRRERGRGTVRREGRGSKRIG